MNKNQNNRETSLGIITYQSYPEMGVSCINVVKGSHNIEWGIVSVNGAMISARRSVRVHGECRDRVIGTKMR